MYRYKPADTRSPHIDLQLKKPAKPPDWTLHGTDPPRPAGLAPPSRLQESLHRHRWKPWNRTVRLLATSGDPQLRRRAVRINDCCRWATIVVDVTHARSRTVPHRCGDQLCPFCNRKHVADVIAKLGPSIGRMRQARFVTLTVPHTDAPLKQQRRLLLAALCRLRRTPWWKHLVRGSVHTFQVTWRHQEGRWHPHVHLIIDSRWMPWAQLRDHWAAVWPGAEIVDIRRVFDPLAAARELTHYLVRPAEVADWPDDTFLEYVHAVAGTQSIIAAGNCRHAAAAADPHEPADRPDLRDIYLPHLVHLAAAGNVDASDLVVLIYRTSSMFRHYLTQRLHRLPDSCSFDHSITPYPPERASPDRDAYIAATFFARSVTWTELVAAGDLQVHRGSLAG